MKHRYYEYGYSTQKKGLEHLVYTTGLNRTDLAAQLLFPDQKPEDVSSSFSKRVGAVSAALLNIRVGAEPKYGFVQIQLRSDKEVGYDWGRKYAQQRWNIVESDELAALFARGYSPYTDMLANKPKAALTLYETAVGEQPEEEIALEMPTHLLSPLADEDRSLQNVAFWLAQQLLDYSYLQVLDEFDDFITKLSVVQAVQHILLPYFIHHPNYKDNFDNGVLTFALDFVSTKYIPFNIQFYRNGDMITVSNSYSPREVNIGQLTPGYALASSYLRFVQLVFNRLEWPQAISCLSEPAFTSAIESESEDYERVRLRLGFKYPQLLAPDSLDEWASSIVLQDSEMSHMPDVGAIRLVPAKTWFAKLTLLPEELEQHHVLILKRVLQAYERELDAIERAIYELSERDLFLQRIQELLSKQEGSWLTSEVSVDAVLALCRTASVRNFGFAAWFIYHEVVKVPFHPTVAATLDTLQLPFPSEIRSESEGALLYTLLTGKEIDGATSASRWAAAEEKELLFAEYSIPYAIRHHYPIAHEDVECLIALGRHDVLLQLVDHILSDPSIQGLFQDLPSDTMMKWLAARRTLDVNIYQRDGAQGSVDRLYELVKTLAPSDPDLILDVLQSEIADLPSSYEMYTEYTEWMQFVQDEGREESHPVEQLAGLRTAESVYELALFEDKSLYLSSALYLADRGLLPVTDVMYLYENLQTQEEQIPLRILSTLYERTLDVQKTPLPITADLEIPIDALLNEYESLEAHRSNVRLLAAYYLWQITKQWTETPQDTRLSAGQASRWLAIVNSHWSYADYAYVSTTLDGSTANNYLYELIEHVICPTERLVEAVLWEALPVLGFKLDRVMAESKDWIRRLNPEDIERPALKALCGSIVMSFREILDHHHPYYNRLLYAALYVLGQKQLPHIDDITEIQSESKSTEHDTLRDEVLRRVAAFDITPKTDFLRTGATLEYLHGILRSKELSSIDGVYLRLYAFSLASHNARKADQHSLLARVGIARSYSQEIEGLPELLPGWLEKWAALLDRNPREREKYQSNDRDYFYDMLTRQLRHSVNGEQYRDEAGLACLARIGFREISTLPAPYNKFIEFKRWVDLLDRTKFRSGDKWLDSLIHRMFYTNTWAYLSNSSVPRDPRERMILFLLSHAYLSDKNAQPYFDENAVKALGGRIDMHMLDTIRVDVDRLFSGEGRVCF